MDYHAYYAEMTACLAFIVIGVRLHRLGARTGRSPERLLSASFLFWALGYGLYDIPYALTDDESLHAPFSFAARLCLHTGTIALALFNRKVFRSRERWATWLVAGTALCLVASVAGSVRLGDWLGDHPVSNPWYWPEIMASALPGVWMAAEGLHEYGRARHRRRLGLCRPLVCNRFLLWGVAGLFWTMLEVVAVGQEIEYELTQRWSTIPDLVAATCEIIPVALIWLTFFPPTSYSNWIEARAGAADVAAESGAHGI